MKYKERLTKKNANDEVQGNAYMVGQPENAETITKIIFDGTTAEDNYVKSYWLASPGVSFGSGYAKFGPGSVGGGFAGVGFFDDVFNSLGAWYVREFAVRPVVFLKSEVTVEDIKVISGTEEEWTGDGPSMSGLPLESGFVEEGRITVGNVGGDK